MAISSLGVGSGLDISGLVSQLVAAEGQAPLARLDRQEILLQARLSAFGSLKGALATFQSKLQTASNLDAYRSKTTSVGDSSLFTANADSSAAIGSHSVKVEQLAQAHSIATGGFAGIDSTVSTGTLTIEFGTDDAGVFTPNSGKVAQTLTIDGTNNTLAGVRDAINAEGLGVTASIVFNGTDHQLVLTSNETGEENSIKATGIAELTYDPENIPGNTMTTTVDALDSRAIIDGITVTSNSNSMNDAIEGVSIFLRKVDANASSFTVSEDTNQAVSAVKAFVEGYNELMTTVKSISGYDPETETGGPLLGDATVRSIVSQVQRIISTPVDGLDGKYRFIGDIGMATQNDGTLSLNESTLRDAIKDNAIDVGRIFAEGAGVSDSLLSYVEASDKTERGVYDVYINSITPAVAEVPATAGVYTGNWTTFLDDTAGPFSASIGNNENDFTITVDGVTSGLITLTNATYNTSAALVAEIQAQIDADATLSGAGVGVTVAYESNGVDSGRFVFTSNSTGSTSDVTLASTDGQMANNMGFDETILNNVAGTDLVPATEQIIDATIGGYAATQDGNYLIGAVGTPVEGLKIEYLGGGIGDRGTVSFTRGMASVLDNMINGLLEDDGVFDTRNEIYNDSIDDISSQREAINRRLAQVEQRYYTQFIALDTMIAQMQSTGNYLQQQLAGLPGARSAPTGGSS
jgi:flagellar hook-associated protein 2